MRPFPRSNSSANRLLVGSLVEYQQHGKTSLGVVVGEKKTKFVILNAQQATLELTADRLVLLQQQTSLDSSDAKAVAQYLVDLDAQASEIQPRLELDDAWELLLGEAKEFELSKLEGLLFENISLEQRIALRREVFGDCVYFKRKKKSELFEPRSPALVDELLHQRQVELEKQNAREQWTATALQRLEDSSKPMPEPIDALEQLAALGKSAANAKETQLLVDQTLERANLAMSKVANQRAFDLLVALKHFTPHQLLTPYRLQRPTRFSEEEQQAAATILSGDLPHVVRSDLRPITIDGPDTKDFDDALSFQRIAADSVKIGVHISDVSSIITPSSPLFKTALRRATSIYCPDSYLPMLPRTLSEQSLSLQENAQRPVVSFYFTVNNDFEIVSSDLSLEFITVAKRATYEQVDACLCEGLQELEEYEELLGFCWELASASEVQRIEQGAAQFVRRELSPVIDENGVVTVSPSDEDTPARKLVSELMILANQAAAQFADRNNIPLLFRAQEAPDVDYLSQGEHIPEGPARSFFQRSFFKRSGFQVTAAPHFGLGVAMYTQITSPIRRAIDLLNQQQLSAFLRFERVEHSAETISEYYEELQKGLDEAFQIQRESNRFWLLQYLAQSGHRQTEATVMKVDGPRPLAEIDLTYSIFSFYAAKGSQPKPGDRITLEIQSINPKKESIVLKQLQ